MMRYQCFNVLTTYEPVSLTDNLVFLAEIPRFNDFEAKEPMEKVIRNGKYEDDYVLEDSALAYKLNDCFYFLCLQF